MLLRYTSILLLASAMLVASPRTLVAQPLAAPRAAVPEPRISETLQTVQRRYLQVGVHTPWQIMHGVLALGDGMTLVEGAERRPVGGIDFICRSSTLQGRRILEPTAHGVHFIDSEDTEGHPDQFLAYFGLAGVPLTTPLQVGDREFSLSDLLKQAQAETGQHNEATFTIIAVASYGDADAEWYNQSGQRYTLASLLDWELRQSVNDGACGGTHRLTAITAALNRYRATGRPMGGVWLRAQETVRRHLDLARQYQNSQGCFSSEFFLTPATTSSFEDRLYAHGHTLEWVLRAVPDEELTAPWVTRAVDYLCAELIENQRRAIECGALYHAAAGLNVYRSRVYPAPAPAPQTSNADDTSAGN